MKRVSLLLARLFLGFSFLVFGWTKVFDADAFEGKPFRESFESFVANSLQGRPFGFWRPILQDVVLPNPGLFAGAVAWGELLLGISFVAGALVSVSSIAGIALMASIQFCENPLALEGPLMIKVGGFLERGALALLLLLLAAFGAGRVYGLDGFLALRKEKKKGKP